MAKVLDLLSAGRTYSFEFFPPKNDAEQGRLVQTLQELQPLRPSFVSVTYRGGPSSRQRTTDLVVSMLRLTALNPMAHLTCAGHSRLELADILVTFRKAGIENLMALSGDPVDGQVGPDELAHAIELVDLARAIGGFCVGVAAHPGGHPRSTDMGSDRRYLAEKMVAADFAVTQFFFDAADYFSLVDDLEKLGMTKPVLPGILPVTNLSSVPRMAQMGCAVPAALVEILQRAAERGGPEDVAKAGIDAAARLCARLLEEGAPGLHFYTFNRSEATRRIHADLGLSSAPSAAQA